jgi:hypothetical protein
MAIKPGSGFHYEIRAHFRNEKYQQGAGEENEYQKQVNNAAEPAKIFDLRQIPEIQYSEIVDENEKIYR